MSLCMLEILCDNDPVKIAEAEEAATKAVQARIDFWDGVLLAIKNGEFNIQVETFGKTLKKKPYKSLEIVGLNKLGTQ